MNKIDKLLIRFLTIALPVVLGILFWAAISDPHKMSTSSGLTRFAWDTLGWIFIVWIVVLFYLVVKMVFQKKIRDELLGRAAGIEERDERESQIVGEAAKISLLSTMALLTLLLFLSIFTITIARDNQSGKLDKKRSSLSIEMNFSHLADTEENREIEAEELKIFTYSGVPISSFMLLLLILIWQICSYRYVVYTKNIE